MLCFPPATPPPLPLPDGPPAGPIRPQCRSNPSDRQSGPAGSRPTGAAVSGGWGGGIGQVSGKGRCRGGVGGQLQSSDSTTLAARRWSTIEVSFFLVVATRPAPQSTSNYPHPPRISYGLPVTRMSPRRKFPFSRGLIDKYGILPSHKHPKHYLQLPCQLCAHCPIAQYEIMGNRTIRTFSFG